MGLQLRQTLLSSDSSAGSNNYRLDLNGCICYTTSVPFRPGIKKEGQSPPCCTIRCVNAC